MRWQSLLTGSSFLFYFCFVALKSVGDRDTKKKLKQKFNSDEEYELSRFRPLLRTVLEVCFRRFWAVLFCSSRYFHARTILPINWIQQSSPMFAMLPHQHLLSEVFEARLLLAPLWHQPPLCAVLNQTGIKLPDLVVLKLLVNDWLCSWLGVRRIQSFVRLIKCLHLCRKRLLLVSFLLKSVELFTP